MAETKLNIQQAIGTPRNKLLAFTRDLSLAGGDVSYTGLGFKPTAIIVLCAMDSSTRGMSIGMSDYAGSMSEIDKEADGNYYASINRVLINFSSAGNYQFAAVKSYDSDGFTLTWTKGGSPTGTISAWALCFK